MEQGSIGVCERTKPRWIVSGLPSSHFFIRDVRDGFSWLPLLCAAVLLSFAGVAAWAQSSSLPQQAAIRIRGMVRNSAGEPLTGVTVTLVQTEHSFRAETKTNEDGTFLFLGIAAGIYVVSAEKTEWGKAKVESVAVAAGENKRIDLVLIARKGGDTDASGTGSRERASPGSMEFEDTPNFTIAGVTDWSNVGLHGSGNDVRTSEALAKDTLALRPGASEESAGGAGAKEGEAKLRAAVAETPDSFEANHRLGKFYCRTRKYAEAIPLLEAAQQLDSKNSENSYELGMAYAGIRNWDRSREQVRFMLKQHDTGETHRRAGNIYEQLGDPTEAADEYERAVQMDGSEENYFEWGSELLAHRAAEAAVEIFAKGSELHPDSARMLTGLGAALYGVGSYDDAAKRLCKAADLKPQDPAPYIFLGKIEKASPEALPCSEETLARYAKDQPENAVANYYYGLILWKRAKASDDAGKMRRAQALLEKAVRVDPKFDEGYLQLGIVFADRGDFVNAIRSYKKAIEVNSHLGEAHYRLGQAYKRMGEESEAQQEFQIYKQIQKDEEEARLKERRTHLQLLVTPKEKPVDTTPR